MSRMKVVLCCVAFLAWTGTASATLVTNGNFASGDFRGWLLGGSPGIGQTMSPDGSITIDALYPNTGDTYDAAFSALAPGGNDLSQSIITIFGQSYNLQFALTDQGFSASDQFQVSFDGIPVFTSIGAFWAESPYGAGMYQDFSIPVTGTGSDTLDFQGVNPSNMWNLDDVSLDPVGPTTSVPEPSALLIFAGGLLLVAGYWGTTRRKQMP